MNDKIKEYLNNEVFYLGLVYKMVDCVIEVSGDNYKRIPVVFSLNNFEIKEDSLVNRNKIEFNCAKSNWGDFNGVGIFKSKNDNRGVYVKLPIGREIVNGVVVLFCENCFVVSLKDLLSWNYIADEFVRLEDLNERL